MFFLLYTLLLLLGGIAMIVVGVAVKEQGKGSRILNVVIGLAFFGYGFYLLFLFDGDSYRIFFYVFVLPILLIVRAVKARKEAREQAAAQQYAGGQQYPGGQHYPGGPQQPGPYPAAGHGQPGPAFPPAQGQHAQGQPVPGQSAPYGAAPQGHPAQPAPQGWHPNQPAPHGIAPQAHPGQPAPQGWHQAQPGSQDRY
ncbi:hypothetical protein [Micromonospora sp. WMMA1976]|uniref:hypothetical protein n=1 Tax=Micromonospora sp. WMMA1976 TaxID=3014995 RepID=UPI00248C740D|nr:hypothetical protein [Micromonospora sp. WMMA1976]WBC01185.1 hypothetical protein O7546_18685 [Micromonospora sp. WMMA1976]